jgi:hypothetical protein
VTDSDKPIRIDPLPAGLSVSDTADGDGGRFLTFTRNDRPVFGVKIEPDGTAYFGRWFESDGEWFHYYYDMPEQRRCRHCSDELDDNDPPVSTATGEASCGANPDTDRHEPEEN